MRYSILLMAVFALALSACGGADSPDAMEEREVKFDSRLEPFVAQATGDLARRLDIDASEISVLTAEFVTWPNSALGCPEPDMMYTQALVPGYRIRLRADGALHHYHGASDRPPLHCPAERVTEPASGKNRSGDVS